MKTIRKYSVKLRFVILGTIAGICCWSCNDSFDEHALVTDVPVSIQSFIVKDREAEIDNQANTITAALPYMTDITDITPQLTIPEGASVSPEAGAATDFSNTVPYTVTHGNIYNTYNVTISALPPISSFTINGVAGTIRDNQKTITLILPEGTDFTALSPVIELSEGVSVSPASGTVIDFSTPVTFTVSATGGSEAYQALVSTPAEGPNVVFLGTATTRQGIRDPDEIAAADWLFTRYPAAQYLSFSDIASGTALDGTDVIWWHYDEAADLPGIASDSDVTAAFQTYLDNGGNLLLTGFASQYTEILGIVPPGKGPNNVFGDFPPNGSVDPSNNWGISFAGHEDHPVFAGLETYAPGKAYLLEKGTFRLNHTAWWFLPDWGGYENGAGWRAMTGGNNLASEAWDDTLDGRVTIAEFPGGASDITTVVISMGAYDWYNENDANGNPSQENAFLGNIRLLTENSINYLADH